MDSSDMDIMPTVFTKEFPFGRPGAPIRSATTATTRSGDDSPGDSIWAPFLSQRDWEIAQWAKTEHLTASGFSALLAITGVRELDMYPVYCSANPRYRSLNVSSYHIAP